MQKSNYTVEKEMKNEEKWNRKENLVHDLDKETNKI